MDLKDKTLVKLILSSSIKVDSRLLNVKVKLLGIPAITDIPVPSRYEVSLCGYQLFML